MNIYTITFIRLNNIEHKTVFASTVLRAIDDFARFARKNYWSECIITGIEHTSKVDIFYKSPARKAKKKS